MGCPRPPGLPLKFGPWRSPKPSFRKFHAVTSAEFYSQLILNPIAHATGGLNDTITRHNPYAQDDAKVAVAAAIASDLEDGDREAADLGPGTGWLFNDMDKHSFMHSVSNACKLYHENPKMWRAMQIQAMVGL